MIELSNKHGKVFVKVDKILAIEPDYLAGSLIMLEGAKSHVVVKEKPEEVIKIINNKNFRL